MPVLGNSAFRLQVAERKRSLLYSAIREQVGSISTGELEMHFASMPQRYWLRVDLGSLIWHLSTAQAFFQQVVEAHSTTTSPVLWARPMSEDGVANEGMSEVAVCSWDRPGLLLGISGALSRAGFNIVRADIYTRADNVALDIFQIYEPKSKQAGRPELRMNFARRLLASAMSATLVPMAQGIIGPRADADIRFDNKFSDAYTVIHIATKDQSGLLYRILGGLVSCGFNVEQSRISTVQGRAKDLFCVTDLHGLKIEDPKQIELAVERIKSAIGAHHDFVPPMWGADPLEIIDN